MKKDTSWNGVAKWYDELLENTSGTYQTELILPNLVRLVQPKKGVHILDLACGQGFFSRAFAQAGAAVVGIDSSKRLIEFAKAHSPKSITYHVGHADALTHCVDQSMDVVVIVLAIQNIENINGVFAECKRALKPNGRVLMVLNHPAFRIPKASDWEHDKTTHVMYRRIAGYLVERKIEIDMHPGKKPSEKTVSFHRPLQVYSKALAKSGFAISRLEEWDSHKKSLPGPRQKAEDNARKEIPLFLLIEATKL